MQEVIRQLRELRAAAGVTDEQFHNFVKLCDELKVPQVTIFAPTGYEGWYQMQHAYVFTERKDAHECIWYFSPRSGLMIYDRDGKNGVPLDQWDPQADLFTDPSFDAGATNMDPVERMRRGIRD